MNNNNNHDGDENGEMPDGNIAQVAIEEIRIPEPSPVLHQNGISTGIRAAVVEGKNLAVECGSDDERMTEIFSAVLGLLHGKRDDQVVPNGTPCASSLPRYKFIIATRSFAAVETTIECLKKFHGSINLCNLTVVALGHPQQLCEECYDEYCCDLSKGPTDDNCSIVTKNGIVRTMETLKKTASRQEYCNFRHTCQLLSQAHIVICPQEFVVSRPLQEKTKLKLSWTETKTVIIFDDGNNIEDISYREASIRIRADVLLQASRNIDDLVQLQMETGDDQDIGNLSKISTYFKKLAVAINERAIPPLPDTNALLNTLFRLGFGLMPTIKKHIETISRVLNWMKPESLAIATKQKLRLRRVQVGVLLDAQRFLYGILYLLGGLKHSDCALQILKYVPEGAQAANTFQSCYMNFGTIMDTRYGDAHSIIISSACLPPWNIFLDQLSTQMKNQFLAPVRIPRQNRTSCFFGHVIAIGATKTRLKVDHENRSRSSIQNEAGKAVLKLVDTLPNGIVVFFPSKKALNDMMAQWKTFCNGTPKPIWSQIEDVKHVFWEELKYPGAEEDAAIVLQNFREKCKSPENGKTGAILLALHRENVSRLMDFTPDEVSCIVSLGIPFHNKEAFHIDTKLKLIGAKYAGNELATEKKDLWYYAECWNRQNRNFASCIRKDQKWFVGIVLDCRFEETKGKGLLDQLIPQWNLKDWKRYNDFPKLLDELQVFVDESTMQV